MMRRRGVAVCLWGMLSTAGVPRLGHAAAVDTVCAPVHVGLDPGTWNTAAQVFLGEALGQTFLAMDTVITRLTVWRYPNDRSGIGAHLYITGVDTMWPPPAAEYPRDPP